MARKGLTQATYPDQSYLAYLRPTPRPFVRFTCGHFPSGTVTYPHSHACLALHGCLQGPLTLVTPDREHELDAGVFLLIPSQLKHHWRNDSEHTGATLGLLIDTDNPGRWPATAGVDVACRKLKKLVQRLHRFNCAGDRELQHSFWIAADHLTADGPREPMATAGALLTLLAQVVERIEGKTSQTREGDIAQQIRRLLLARVHERLTIAEIARELAISPTVAKEAFRSAFGSGIIAYFNQLKIWQAKRLLCDPSLTAEQVSHRLGFANPAYFSRVFRQLTGETPGAFRNDKV